ncbi:28S ribosomal protein S5 mitochondrial [Echinococcus multilocularis]|uniref:Small ribosomal subunit protein uS5m n=1 Tax=Echinococcus multilocularis TaxID=6211 RepID=A0A068Y2V0_ECHMU|nr:28S ribosomal protein S5 mitochondrial [Echinococcus multilocularis]
MVSRLLTPLLRKGFLSCLRREISPYGAIIPPTPGLLLPSLPINPLVPRCLSDRPNFCVIPVRNSTVFTSLPGDVIWEGVTGPKGSTKKRARGKRRVTRPKIDLNRGQRLGGNREGYLWPGLNAPLYRESTLQKVQKGDVNQEYLNKLEELRNKSAVKKKRVKLPPLLRGWTGASMGGQSLGPLDSGPPGFDTRVLELKAVSTMTATVGRYRRFSALVVAGNGRGVCGVGKARSVTLRGALKRAKNRAFLNLISFNLKESRTLWHLGHVREWHTTIYATPKPEGHGLICHRAIKTLCDLIGIKDMHAKVEGNTKNYLSIVRGFLRLLHEQESYEDVSNRLGMHVVEFSKDFNSVPRVLASPRAGITQDCVSYAGLKSDPLLGSRPPPKPPKVGNRYHIDLLSLHAFWEAQEKEHGERSPLLITKPGYRSPVPKPDPEFDPIDQLLDEEDEAEEEVQRLLERGERDLGVIITLKGLVPNIKKNPLPTYLSSAGVLKRAAERHRYRNQEAARRERIAYAKLDEQ